jgi:iron complex outermembrane receptor protein
MANIHRSGAWCLVLGAIGVPISQAAQDPGARTSALDLKKLSIEALMDLEVTSVSKQPERLADAAASIFVITSDVIRRSGATSFAEALRLAPNLEVARIDASQYAISARGFNNAVGNKLLVLIDGRTIYTPIFSGVFWDQQHIMLEDVERIEVISGPGATLWGANAVNGVINVISRHAGDTQGALLAGHAGDREVGARLRYGGRLGENGHFRVYADGAQLDNTRRANDTDVADGFDRAQAGFRADWQAAGDTLTVQGDVYSGHAEDRGAPAFGPVGRIESSGANLLTRWTREFDASNLQIQAYADHTERDDTNTFSPNADVFDVELQHSVRREAHRFIWGGGYRHGRDEVTPGMFLGLIPSGFIPASRGLDWWNVFGQADFVLGDLTVTAGLKLEHNDYTGVEYLPSARFVWKVSPEVSVWAAASRAVRAPSRIDRDLFLPTQPPFLIAGGPDFVSEIAHVYEMGLRGYVSSSVTYSATLFWHDWDKLRSGSAPLVTLENKIHGTVRGLEAWGTWEVASGWRLSGGLITLHKDLELAADSTDPSGVTNPNLSNDPDYQAMLRASVDIASDHQLDLTARHVARLPNPVVPHYTAVDLRYGWRARAGLELALVVRNALDDEHAEFNDLPDRSEIAREIYGQIRWNF